MRSVKKTHVKLFRLSFSTGSASRMSQSKKVVSKKPFFDCVRRKLDLSFITRKRPFSTYKSDCIRNGLSPFSFVGRFGPTVHTDVTCICCQHYQNVRRPPERLHVSQPISPPAEYRIMVGIIDYIAYLNRGAQSEIKEKNENSWVLQQWNRDFQHPLF